MLFQKKKKKEEILFYALVREGSWNGVGGLTVRLAGEGPARNTSESAEVTVSIQQKAAL